MKNKQQPFLASRDAWSDIADRFDKTRTTPQMRIAEDGLRRAGLREGMRFLDVAAGSGALSVPAARLGAKVTATDISPAMLELLDKRARQEGLDIETREMDGQALELDDSSFDMAGSQFGVMLFPDMPKGIREMARVVKSGGQVLINAYGNPRDIEFLRFFTESIQSVRPDFKGLPTDPPPLEFQLSDPERMRSELAAAGLEKITVETIIETNEHRTGKDLWEWILWSNPITEAVLSEMLRLTDNERDIVRDSLDTLVKKRSGINGNAVLTNPVNIGIGTKR